MSLPRLDRQFVHQAVRDLAFLLCAPSPWRTRHDMPRERLLGPNGATLLSTLDASPGALCNWVAAHRAKRLGHYAEQLLAFWFELAPHIELVKANLVLRASPGILKPRASFICRLVRGWIACWAPVCVMPGS
jgi:hypothetical protein